MRSQRISKCIARTQFRNSLFRGLMSTKDSNSGVRFLRTISGADVGKGLAGSNEVLFINGIIPTENRIIKYDIESVQMVMGKCRSFSTTWYFMRKRGDMWCYAASGIDKDIVRIVENTLYRDAGKAIRTNQGNVLVCIGKLFLMERCKQNSSFPTLSYNIMRLENGMTK